MKNFILLLSVCVLSVQPSFSQNADNYAVGNFVKRVEYNTLGGCDMYNLDSKSKLDKIILGMSNFFVEYVFNPSSRDALALRVVKDSLEYKLDVFRLPEYNKVLYKIRKDENLLSTQLNSDSLMTFSQYSELVEKQKDSINSWNHNFKLHKKYGPKPKSFKISERFAIKVHDKVADLIRDFKVIRVKKYDPGTIITIFDGESATFRCVVGDELWSLWVHVPQQKTLELSDLFNQMILEADEGSQGIDEAKYSKLLDEID